MRDDRDLERLPRRGLTDFQRIVLKAHRDRLAADELTDRALIEALDAALERDA